MEFNEKLQELRKNKGMTQEVKESFGISITAFVLFVAWTFAITKIDV